MLLQKADFLSQSLLNLLTLPHFILLYAYIWNKYNIQVENIYT